MGEEVSEVPKELVGKGGRGACVRACAPEPSLILDLIQ